MTSIYFSIYVLKLSALFHEARVYLNSLIIVTNVTSHFSAAIYLPDKSADAALMRHEHASENTLMGAINEKKGKSSLKTDAWAATD